MVIIFVIDPSRLLCGYPTIVVSHFSLRVVLQLIYLNIFFLI